MNVLLTGATGLLGRNILFELLKQNIYQKTNYHITVIGRSKGERSLRDRIFDIIRNDGIDYLSIPASDYSEGMLSSYISFIDCDLSCDEFELQSCRMSLKNKSFDWLIHSAALTNFQDTPEIRSLLEKNNICGTSNLLYLTQECRIGVATYIGSAYSCGKKDGLIKEGTCDFNAQFRNPYEKSKLIAEQKFVETFSKRNSIVKVARVSTLCGRLFEKKIGSIPKFDVMYEFGSYLLFRKLVNGFVLDDIYDEFFEYPVPIPCNINAGLNIIPADYAAKSIICILNNIPNSEYYHICTENETPHVLWLGVLSKILNVSDFNYVDEWTELPQNREDVFFRRTMGKIFVPYVVSPTMHFSTENSKSVLEKNGLYLKSLDEDQVNKIFLFAKTKNFGLFEKKSSKRILEKMGRKTMALT